MIGQSTRSAPPLVALTVIRAENTDLAGTVASGAAGGADGRLELVRGESTERQNETVCDLPGARIYGPAFSPDLPDWCTPLDDPRWVTPSEASLMRDEDPILGFEAAGRMWAIPWWVMKNHH